MTFAELVAAYSGTMAASFGAGLAIGLLAKHIRQLADKI